MIINNFSITKDQYDHICYLIATSPRVDQEAIDNGFTPADPEKVQRRDAINYLITLTKGEDRGRILRLYEVIDIVKKIQSKLGYK